MTQFFEQYGKHKEEREKSGIPPLPLSEAQAASVVQLMQEKPPARGEELLELLIHRVTPGVDPAARVKAGFLADIINGRAKCNLIDKRRAVTLLGTMVGGYNLDGLIEVVRGGDPELAAPAAEAIQNLVLAVSRFDAIRSLAEAGNAYATDILKSWAHGEWFTRAPAVPASIQAVVYKVDGEINTDDLSPASQAFNRADIPLHALSMGGALFPTGPQDIARLRQQHGLPVAFVGDVVGTGSSRKSACNSLLWHIGEEIPWVPNKKRGGIIIGGIIAPIFFNTAEDSGALPIQAEVGKLRTGMVITVYPGKGEIADGTGNIVSRFALKPVTILDEYRAGGRVPLIIGKQLTGKARSALGMSSVAESGIFVNPDNPEPKAGQQYTLAQKIIGKACGEPGILPGTACLPRMTTVGSQDTTGPMTAGEATELACLRFEADLVMQSFCHTAAYPKATDVRMHGSLSSFISSRGGVALRPGDGVIHSWINRLLIPDTVGTGGDSHTRFPIGISFPAGSGLVAFAAALGFMPLDMPESVLVRFKGALRPGITLRDVVNMIPLQAIRDGLLTVPKANKKNIFAGRILEMEGLPDLKVEQAFELTDASAERSAAAATIRLGRASVEEFLRSNIALMEAMIQDGYADGDTLRRRVDAARDWLEKGELLEADIRADYAAVIEIDLDQMSEPILACPNDPDDVRPLSEVEGDRIDEVFIGSCMTNIGQFRAAARIFEGAGRARSTLWLCPPTRMDADQLRAEGLYAVYAAAGARVEIPGCSLCMGNQARVADGATVMSTSTRNFNNRLGTDARVYLGSSELAAVTALMGKLPSLSEYNEMVRPRISGREDEIYRYLNFHEKPSTARSRP